FQVEVVRQCTGMEIEIEKASCFEVARSPGQQKSRLDRKRGGTHASGRRHEGNARGLGLTIEAPSRARSALAGLKNHSRFCIDRQPVGNVEPEKAADTIFVERL